MTKNKVSVIVPLYNREKYIDECLKSICGQTYYNIEIIVIDDGSNDNSLRIAKDWEDKDDRIILRHTDNNGVSLARNLGMELASGDWIVFVDSDDVIDNSMIKNLLNVATNNKVDMVVCGIQEFQEKKQSKIKKSYLSGEVITIDEYVRYLANYNIDYYFGGPVAKLYSAEVLKKNKIEFEQGETLGEDFIFNLNILKNIKQIGIVSKCMYFYRTDSFNSISRAYKDTDYVIIRYKKMFCEYVKLLKKYNLFSLCQMNIKQFEMRILRILLGNITFDKNISNIVDKAKKMKQLKKCKEDYIRVLFSDVKGKNKIVLVLYRLNCYFCLQLLFHFSYCKNYIVKMIEKGL